MLSKLGQATQAVGAQLTKGYVTSGIMPEQQIIFIWHLNNMYIEVQMHRSDFERKDLEQIATEVVAHMQWQHGVEIGVPVQLKGGYPPSAELEMSKHTLADGREIEITDSSPPTAEFIAFRRGKTLTLK